MRKYIDQKKALVDRHIPDYKWEYTTIVVINNPNNRLRHNTHSDMLPPLIVTDQITRNAIVDFITQVIPFPSEYIRVYKYVQANSSLLGEFIATKNADVYSVAVEMSKTMGMPHLVTSCILDDMCEENVTFVSLNDGTPKLLIDTEHASLFFKKRRIWDGVPTNTTGDYRILDESNLPFNVSTDVEPLPRNMPRGEDAYAPEYEHGAVAPYPIMAYSQLIIYSALMDVMPEKYTKNGIRTNNRAEYLTAYRSYNSIPSTQTVMRVYEDAMTHDDTILDSAMRCGLNTYGVRHLLQAVLEKRTCISKTILGYKPPTNEECRIIKEYLSDPMADRRLSVMPEYTGISEKRLYEIMFYDALRSFLKDYAGYDSERLPIPGEIKI